MVRTQEAVLPAGHTRRRAASQASLKRVVAFCIESLERRFN
jgi:hypothetical protein